MDDTEKTRELLRELLVFQADASDMEKRLYDMSNKALELQKELKQRLGEGNDADNQRQN